MRPTFTATLVMLIMLRTSVPAMEPNPLISRYQPIYASFSGSPTMLVNGKFGETAWTVTDSSWIAINLENDFSAIFFTWNSSNRMWSDSIGNPRDCAEGLPLPVDYQLLISGNSTNGIDGSWKAVDSVSGNVVSSRGHGITFNGNRWVKMFVGKGGGKIDEIEVFDASKGTDDTWFFLGTGITANTFKQPVQIKDFRSYIMEYVKEFNPAATPAFLRGGIGCATSNGLAADINKIIAIAGNVSYFAIEVGTYDAQGGTDENVATFTDNLRTIITTCKSKGIKPVIARVPATNPEKASWQIHEGYLKAIDALTKKYKLIPGPDLYTWFLQHPDELSDGGILPSPRGGASIQRLWAEAVYKQYESKTPKKPKKLNVKKK